MNKNRKTSHILNVFQFDANGHVILPATLTIGENPHSSDNTSKIPSTAWIRTYVTGLSYLTGNQSITVSGDATGSGTTAITLTLANTAVTPGTYGSTTLVPVVTVDSKGRITSVTTAAISGSLTFTGDVTGTGTTGTSTGLTLAASGVTAGTYTKVTVDSKGRVTVGASASTTDISEGTNLYYTDTRVGAYLTANSYATQSYVGTQIANLVASAPATLDTLNELSVALGNDPNFATSVATSIGTKQAQLNGTGFVKVVGTTVSYDNNTYLTSFTETDPTVPSHVKSITTTEKANWNTAYGWGNHASGGYLTGITSSQVTTALGYTPYNSTNPSGYITGITSGNVITALGYTPYNSTNPSGYITSSGSITGTAGSTGLLTIDNSVVYGRSGLQFAQSANTAGNTASNHNTPTADWWHVIRMNHANGGGYYADLAVSMTTNLGLSRRVISNGSQLSNWVTILDALNYNSYSPTLTGTGASGSWGISITGSAGSVAWTNVTSRPTALSQFTNDLGNYGGWITGYTETDTLASVTGRGATTTAAITVTASEGREVAVYMPSSYTTNDLVSGHEYGWYDDHWRLGMTRSGSAPGADFVVQWNAARRLSLTNGGNLTVTGTISASNLSGTNTGDQTNISGSSATVTHYGSRDDVASYNVVWAAGNPSHMYSCDAVRIQSSTGTLFATRSAAPMSATVASGNWDTSFSNTPVSTMAWGGDISSGGPTGTWWFQMNMRHSNASNLWGTQLAYGWEDNANQLYQRNVTGGNWSAWVRYLNSGNYSSYALPLTGGTLSGTLNFSQPVGLGFANGQYIKDNGSGGLVIYSGAAININGTTVTAGTLKISSASDNPTCFTNADLGNTFFTDRGGRILTSNGTNWASDGRDAAVVISGSYSTTTRGLIGLAFHNETTVTNSYSPMIAFSSKSGSGGYNTVYASIMGKYVGNNLGVDSNWGKGELHFYAHGDAYVDDTPTMRLAGSGYLQIASGGGSNTATLSLLQTGASNAYIQYSGGKMQFGGDSGLTDGIYFNTYNGSNYGDRVKISITGTLTASGDIVAYGSPSDNRLKTIKSKVSNAVEKVGKLNGYYFDWNEVNDLAKIKEDIGVIAQEVIDVFPELARTNDDGFMSVRYQGLTAVLIEAIKEQQLQIEELKNKLDGLTR